MIFDIIIGRFNEFQINNRYNKPARFEKNLAGLSVSAMLNNSDQLFEIHNRVSTLFFPFKKVKHNNTKS